LLKDAFHSRVTELIFVQHGTDKYKTLEAKPGMLFADIVPPPDRAQEFIDTGALVLDHHKKVQSVVEAFGENGIFADEEKDPGISGTSLVFEHVWKPLREGNVIQAIFAQRFARLAGIRDTWQRDSPDWREACAQAEILMFFPVERWLKSNLTMIAAQWGREYRPIGEVLLERKEASTAKLLAQTYRFQSMKGTRVAMFNNLHSSDVADALDKEVDLVVGFSYSTEIVDSVQKRKLILSTRSHTGYDCARFCAAYSGGGHTAAAGCSVPLLNMGEDPYTEVQCMLNDYEGSAQRPD
jgi:oligoribonuclease NrnB/cAMP/cGMP phosphodiesterase (DHH superfamily)